MNLPILIVALFGPVAIAGCTHPPTMSPFSVAVRGPASTCIVEIDGRKISTDELLAVARLEAKPGRRARIISHTPRTPYQCLGGTIYMLQTAGFKEVGVVAAPPP